MSIVQHENSAHALTCNLSEGTRQSDVAAAQARGGSMEAEAIRTAEIAHYRRVIASCEANGLPFVDFKPALRDLGTDGT
jgi:hypothetical protein